MGGDTVTGDSVYPPDLKYSREHEWVRVTGTTVRVGITWYAQDALGDIVYVSLPDVGAQVTGGEPFGEVESTKSVSDVYAPASGEVVGRNDALDGSPELVNSDPYGEGWLIEVAVSDLAALDGLLDAHAYVEHVRGS
jgi:glycine cleavage system H protein